MGKYVNGKRPRLHYSEKTTRNLPVIDDDDVVALINIYAPNVQLTGFDDGTSTDPSIYFTDEVDLGFYATPGIINATKDFNVDGALTQTSLFTSNFLHGETTFTNNVLFSGTAASISLTGPLTTLTIGNIVPSAGSGSGAFQCAGGGYFGAASVINSNLTISGTSSTLSLTGASSTLSITGASGKMTVANTTPSTSNSTGAFQCAGGAYFGSASILNSDVTLSGTSATLAISGASGKLTLSNTTASTNSSTGAIQCAGGSYFGAASIFNSDVTLSGTSATLAIPGSSGKLTLSNTTASTNSSSGAIQCAGGSYFGAASIFNSDVTLSGTSATLAISGASGKLTLSNTAASTDSITGAIQCAGGAYFGAACQIATNLTLTSTSSILDLAGVSSKLTISNTTGSTSNSTGALQCAGGGYFGAACLFNSNVTLSGTSATLAISGSSGKLTLSNTEASTSNSTGAIQCAGGAYIGGGVNFGNSTLSKYVAKTSWTPTLTDVSGLTGGNTSLVNAYYERIGDLVFCTVRFNADPSSAAPTSFELACTVPISTGTIIRPMGIVYRVTNTVTGNQGFVTHRYSGGSEISDTVTFVCDTTSTASTNYLASFMYPVYTSF